MGPYLQLESAQPYRLVDIYGKGNTGPFPEDSYVLCDTYERRQTTGAVTGMPILYYKADPSGAHDPNDPNSVATIYHWEDNYALLRLGVPWAYSGSHPLADPNRFYVNITDYEIGAEHPPHRADSYILISAGWDGLYGTADDICNFDWKYRRQ